jgi:hypothetical protein
MQFYLVASRSGQMPGYRVLGRFGILRSPFAWQPIATRI